MSEDRIPSTFYMQQPKRKKQQKYKKDLLRPECVNYGCNTKVHLIRYDDNGKPIYRSVCDNCHYANIGGEYKNYKYKQGVIPIKKDYCENYLDERLGRPCPTQHDKTKINMAGETGALPSEDLDLDHIDGDHYNNTPENTQTLCKSDHAYKTKMMGDHRTRGSNAFVRDSKKKREDLRILAPESIEHSFWEN